MGVNQKFVRFGSVCSIYLVLQFVGQRRGCCRLYSWLDCNVTGKIRVIFFAHKCFNQTTRYTQRFILLSQLHKQFFKENDGCTADSFPRSLSRPLGTAPFLKLRIATTQLFLRHILWICIYFTLYQITIYLFKNVLDKNIFYQK